MVLNSSLNNHQLRYKQWLLKHKMSLLHVIDCFLGWCAHEKSFLKTFTMNSASTTSCKS